MSFSVFVYYRFVGLFDIQDNSLILLILTCFSVVDMTGGSIEDSSRALFPFAIGKSGKICDLVVTIIYCICKIIPAKNKKQRAASG